jgi:hypothetical protein
VSPADPRTVHVNSLRWFASAAGGTEFVRAHDDGLDDATVALALTTPYPGAQHVLRTLEAAGVAADCWFVVDGSSGAVPADGASGGTVNGSITRALPPVSDDVPLGGLTLVVGDDADRDGSPDRTRLAPDAAIAGLICDAPAPDAIPRTAQALADAFGPQVVWADDLTEVMLVRPGMTVDQVRARWTRGQADDGSA